MKQGTTELASVSATLMAVELTAEPSIEHTAVIDERGGAVCAFANTPYWQDHNHPGGPVLNLPICRIGKQTEWTPRA